MTSPAFQWSPFDCDGLAIRFIPLKLLQEESALNETKHWDYRYLHPAQATQLYGEAYGEALKRAVSRRTDLWRGLMMKGLKDPVIYGLDGKIITSFWKGRQMADRIGCDYTFYCEHAMQFADRARMHFLPTAQQMYCVTVPERLQGLPSMVEYIVERWRERTRTSGTYAFSPAYLAHNFQGGSDQIDYLNYLLTKIKTSNLPEGVLVSAMEKGQISEEQVLTAFPKSGKDLLRRAARLRD